MPERLSCSQCSELLIVPVPGIGKVESLRTEPRRVGGGISEFRVWRVACGICRRGFRLGFDDSLTWNEYIRGGPIDLGIGQCPRCKVCYCGNCADRIEVAENAPSPWTNQPNPLEKDDSLTGDRTAIAQPPAPKWWQFWKKANRHSHPELPSVIRLPDESNNKLRRRDTQIQEELNKSASAARQALDERDIRVASEIVAKVTTIQGNVPSIEIADIRRRLGKHALKRKVRRLRFLKVLRRFPGDKMAISLFSPDGEHVVSSVMATKSTVLLDWRTGEELQTLWPVIQWPNISIGANGLVAGLVDSPEGRTMSAVDVVEIKSGETKYKINTGDRTFTVQLSANGRLLGFDRSPNDHRIRVWDLVENKPTLDIPGVSAAGRRSLSFSYNNEHLIVAGPGRAIGASVWHLPSSRCIQEYHLHNDSILCCSFLPSSGTLAVTGSSDNTIHLWDVTSGALVRRFEGHSNWVQACSVSTRGDLIASASSDTSVRIWEVATGDCIARLEGHANGLCSVSFSPDGHLIVSSDHSMVILWEVEWELEGLPA